MEVVTISSKYQIVIPREVRKQFNVKPGQKIMFIPYNGTLRVVVVPTTKQARGLLKSIFTDNIREEADWERNEHCRFIGLNRMYCRRSEFRFLRASDC